MPVRKEVWSFSFKLSCVNRPSRSTGENLRNNGVSGREVQNTTPDVVCEMKKNVGMLGSSGEAAGGPGRSGRHPRPCQPPCMQPPWAWSPQLGSRNATQHNSSVRSVVQPPRACGPLRLTGSNERVHICALPVTLHLTKPFTTGSQWQGLSRARDCFVLAPALP